MKKLRAQLTYANVVATLALVVAVAGGTTAIAASVGKNSVTTKSIKDGNITGPDLARIIRVTVSDPSGSPVTAVCPGKSVVISGTGTSPDGPGPSGQPNSWTGGAAPVTGPPGQHSTAKALCLSGKSGK